MRIVVGIKHVAPHVDCGTRIEITKDAHALADVVGDDLARREMPARAGPVPTEHADLVVIHEIAARVPQLVRTLRLAAQ